jgi:sirohydrochlorin ferrochelatase
MSEARAVLLVSHGSRDPRAQAAVERLAADVARRQSGARVRLAYLDFAAPTVGQALRDLTADGVRDVVAVPLLFAPGYHVRVDLPSAIAEVRAGCPDLRVHVAAPLGQDEPARLLDALDAGLPAERLDAFVLASAGSSDPLARRAIERIAAAWSARIDRPVIAAYATGSGPDVGEAVARLGTAGRRVGVSRLFLAPGRLSDAVDRSGRAAGAVHVSPPLGDVAPDPLARLVVDRTGVPICVS